MSYKSCLFGNLIVEADITNPSLFSLEDNWFLIWLKRTGDCSIHKAALLAWRAHKGQKRRSGEPFIVHPMRVYKLLCEIGADEILKAASLLHDVLEDTEVTAEEIEELGGSQVRILVEGVTKKPKQEKQQYISQMFKAMDRDERVGVLKLADRLDNMRTLKYLTKESQRFIAQETLDVFVPLAGELKLEPWQAELEQLSLQYLKPAAKFYPKNLIPNYIYSTV